MTKRLIALISTKGKTPKEVSEEALGAFKEDQKQLTQEELSNFSLDKAKLIAGEYLRFESQNDFNVYEFEDILPWKKSDIVIFSGQNYIYQPYLLIMVRAQNKRKSHYITLLPIRPA